MVLSSVNFTFICQVVNKLSRPQFCVSIGYNALQVVSIGVVYRGYYRLG